MHEFVKRNCHKIVFVWLLLADLALPVDYFPRQEPRIYNVQSFCFVGFVWVEGFVEDPDSVTTGYKVWFTGDINGEATVDSLGRFTFVAPTELPYGEFMIETMDAQGNVSDAFYKDF